MLQLLHKLGKEVNEANLSSVVKSSGAEVNEAQVKSLVAEEDETSKAAPKAAPVAAAAAPAAAAADAPEKEERRKKNLKTKKQPWKDYHPYSAKQLYFFNLILSLFLLISILITLYTTFLFVDRNFF